MGVAKLSTKSDKWVQINNLQVKYININQHIEKYDMFLLEDKLNSTYAYRLLRFKLLHPKHKFKHVSGISISENNS